MGGIQDKYVVASAIRSDGRNVFAAAVMSGAQSLDEGFPPLAGVNIAAGNQTENQSSAGSFCESLADRND